jgi:hypothetical protein
MPGDTSESYIRNRANLVEHRRAICAALGIPYSDAQVGEPHFFVRLSAHQQQQLALLGLVNRGFCPICGVAPIGTEYYRRDRRSGVFEHICRDCDARLNPFRSREFAVAHYSMKGCMWLLVGTVAVAAYLILRACTQ